MEIGIVQINLVRDGLFERCLPKEAQPILTLEK